jgi:hypothetical protein
VQRKIAASIRQNHDGDTFIGVVILGTRPSLAASYAWSGVDRCRKLPDLLSIQLPSGDHCAVDLRSNRSAQHRVALSC